MLRKALIFLLLLFGCKKIDQEGRQIFTIEKGQHRSSGLFKTTKSQILQFDVMFDSSAVYTVNSQDQADVNKLLGLSDHKQYHMDNSIRLGWRYYNNKLELLWFKHQDGEFSFGHIKYIETDVEYSCCIQISPDEYTLFVDDSHVIVPRIKSKYCYKSMNYRRYFLWPYFGGNCVAPHDIKIKIRI